MSDQPDRPQIYLVTPPAFDPEVFAPQLAKILDAVPVACLRLAMAGYDEEAITRAADVLRDLSHARDVALVIERHAGLVERLGLDGVHLPEGNRDLRKLRKMLGDDAIIGAACGASRHQGISAAEAGVDYVSFAPVGETLLGTGDRVPRDLFEWWSEMIEIPVVAEGALTPALVEDLAPVTDFLSFGEELWRTEDPLVTLRALVAPIGL